METKNKEKVMFGTYFKENPAKILGTVVTHNPNTGRELTDRFGKPRPEVRGTLADALARIDAPDAPIYVHFSGVQTSVLSEEKAKAVIEATMAEASDKGVKYVCGDKLECLGDSIGKYNKGVEYKRADGTTALYDISDEEISIFVTYQVEKGYWDKQTIQSSAWGKYLKPSTSPYMASAFEGNLSAFDGVEWHPASLFYAGNIYEKIKTVQNNGEKIIAEVGQNGYQKILDELEAAKPKPLRFSKDPTEALIISPFDRIWDDFLFTEDSEGVAFEKPVNVRNVFIRWLNTLPPTDFGMDGGKLTSNKRNVQHFWLDGGSFSRNDNYTEEQKATIKRNAQMVGAMLFERFCVEGITRDMQVKVEYLFNSTRNHYVPVQYHRIPVGFEANKFFKGGKLSIRPPQREGVAHLSYRGTGIIAYDVGVGKTMTGILAIEDGFSKGLFKRPLVVVPNGVYWKWVAEIIGIKAEKDIVRDGKKVAQAGDLIAEGILPHRTVNTFYNLGAGIAIPVNGDKTAKRVGEGTITMLTFEGLEKIGFRKDAEKALMEKIVAALSQSEGDREAALKEKAAEGWLDKALLNTEYNIEDFGFDAILVDECHNFRVLFTEVKGDVDGDGERETKRFFATGGGVPSTRAIKLFMLNLFIQSQNNGRNTYGLSATPFTNRATEIYSILSLFDYDGLKEFAVNNLAQFCKTFIDETSEMAWTAQGKFDIKYVIRGYNNLPVLQTILFRSINYKTGEEAKIKRPQKVILPLRVDDKGLPLPPNLVIETKLPNTAEQAKWTKDSYLFASENFELSDIFKTGLYPENEKTKRPDGQVLVALNVARTASFTPYAITLRGESQYDTRKLTAPKIVKSSPKLEYAMGCIKSVRDWHIENGTPVSGQIVYSNVGTGFFSFIKQYLVDEIGYQPNEVEILTGDTPTGKREKIKDGFQDNSIKIIIGSAAIQEGMDLQNHCSVIYDLHIDWNPTNLHQLFGRAWRFGNKFSHVRIVVPQVENTSDIFTWQKLSEKIARLNSVWSRSGVTKMFEEKELNADEMKRALITEPFDLASFEVEEMVAVIESQITTFEAEAAEVANATMQKGRIKSLEDDLNEALRVIENYNPPSWMESQNPKQAERFKEIKAQATTWDDPKTIYRKLREASRWQSANYAGFFVNIRSVDEHIKAKKSVERVQKSILAAYGVGIEGLAQVQSAIEEKIENARAELENVQSDDYFAQVLERVTEEKRQNASQSRSIAQRVEEFASLNYLLDCKFEVDMCDIYGRGKDGKTVDKKAPKGEAVTDSAAVIGEALEALKTALEFTDAKQNEPLKQAIEALQVAIEFL